MADTIMENRPSIIHQQLIEYIVAEKPASNRIWGLWIRQYPLLPDGANDIDFQAFPENVWFMDGSILRRENPWKWMRFLAAQQLAPSPDAQRFFPIGFGAFAPYKDSGDYYLEVMWGGLWGEAWCVRPNSDGPLQILNGLWKA